MAAKRKLCTVNSAQFFAVHTQYCKPGSGDTIPARSLSWVTVHAVATLLATALSLTSLLVSADEAAVFSEVDVEARSTNLFDVPIPAETYDELTGAIGHRAVDMTLSGNGPLSYQTVRQYEEQPEGYAYEFGTMSLATPTLTVDTRFRNNAIVSATKFDCSTWWSEQQVRDNDIRSVWQAIGFAHESGETKLISRQLLDDSFIARFPNDAIYMSKDYHWMRCEESRFIVTAPDGVEYVFAATWNSDQPYSIYNQGAAERTLQYRVRQSSKERQGKLPYHVFRMKVVEKRRLNVLLQYYYELAEAPPVGYQAGAPIVIPDRYYTQKSAQNTRYVTVEDLSIEHKMRLKTVQLIVPGELDRYLHYNYNPGSHQCGYMLSSVESNSSPEKRVRYEYVRNSTLASGDYRPHGLPKLGCVLSKVRRADGSTWEFSYGRTANPQFSVGTNPNSPASSTLVQFKDFLRTVTRPYPTADSGYQPDTPNQITWTAYLPLRSVKIPTGATVTYQYRELGLCEYQDTERRTRELQYNYDEYATVNDCRWGNSTSSSRRPAVLKRTVSGSGLPTSTSVVLYFKDAASYRVERWIQSSLKTSRLVFGRVDRLSGPRSKDSTDEGARLRDSGRLLHAYVYPGRSSPGHPASAPEEPLASVTYTYKTLSEEIGSPLDRGWYEYPWARASDLGNPGFNPYPWWTQVNGRNSWRFDARRVVLDSKVTLMNGAESTTRYLVYDVYNNPTWIMASQRIDDDVQAHSTFQSYDNSPAESAGSWRIGFPTTTKTQTGDRTPSGASEQRYTHRSYSAWTGLLSYEIDDGIETRYWYNPDGTVRIRKRGTTITRYAEYKHGIPQLETIDGVSDRITRAVTDFGALQWRETGDGGRTTYEYRSYDNALTKRILPAPLEPIRVTPPYWQAGGVGFEVVNNLRTRRIAHDALGRVVSDQITDPEYGGITRVDTSYDAFGRVSFQTDAHDRGIAGDAGTHFTYDALGRPLLTRHSSEPDGVLRCYTPNCPDSNELAGSANTIVVRDQAGYLSAYTFRALGSPRSAELVSIREEIRKDGESLRPYETGDRILTTTIERNLTGFVKSVTQGGAWYHKRSWKPRHVGGYATTQVASQYDPERGTREILNFDAEGRPTSVREPDRSEYAYRYDTAGRLVEFDQTSRGTDAAAIDGQVTYEYDEVGRTVEVNQGGIRRGYAYNAAGLVTRELVTVDGETMGFSTYYGGLGGVRMIIYPSGRLLGISSDAFGRQRSIERITSDVQYNPNGALKSYSLSNGASLSVGLDSKLRPRQRRIKDGRGQYLVNATTSYDNRGNLAEVTTSLAPFGAWLGGAQYDGLSRLISIGGRWGSAEYGYDPVGNINGYNVDDYEFSYDYDWGQHLTSTSATGASLRAMSHGDRSLTYDGLGNITSHGDATYQFDGQSRLTEIRRGNFLQENRFDGTGMRVSSKVTEDVENGDPRTKTTLYLYGKGGALLHEREIESGETRDHIQLAGRTIATIGRHTEHDSDGDAVPDFYERLHGMNVHRQDGHLDRDGDGLTNRHEYVAGTSPTRADSDFDGVPDNEEGATDLPAYLIRPKNEPIFTYLMSP